jgi:predicted solute-binding protein
MPDADDSDNLLAGISASIRKKYLPEGTKDLSKLWTELLALSVSLAKILSWQNRAEPTRPSRAEIQHMDESIRQYHLRKDHAMAHRQSYVVSLHEYHLELYIQ